MADVTQEVETLRQQGLSDDQIQQELASKGYQDYEIQNALAPAMETAPPIPDMSPAMPSMPPAMPSGSDFERIEQIAETIIDEKWDALLTEVKKIIDWKSSVEDQLQKSLSELENLKADFKELRTAVLGKVEEYDRRMIDVSTELKAVGKVFKDVIPEFTNNVKELSSISKEIKKK